MPEEKITTLEKEEQNPKTLEELFISEHLSVKNELKNTQDELASVKRALNQVAKELKLLKSIVNKYTSPIKVDKDGHIIDGTISMFIYTNTWDYDHDPELKNEIEYLKTIVTTIADSTEESADDKTDVK